tara:strand:- start:9 stop:305 length:297 start_codon:yes stop_codon:yes gene_type:complete
VDRIFCRIFLSAGTPSQFEIKKPPEQNSVNESGGARREKDVRVLLCEQSKHLKPFFHECRDVFWFDELQCPIKAQMRGEALDTDLILASEESQNFIRE